MASLLSILKNVKNLNRVHVEKSEIVTVPERTLVKYMKRSESTYG